MTNVRRYNGWHPWADWCILVTALRTAGDVKVKGQEEQPMSLPWWWRYTARAASSCYLKPRRPVFAWHAGCSLALACPFHPSRKSTLLYLASWTAQPSLTVDSPFLLQVCSLERTVSPSHFPQPDSFVFQNDCHCTGQTAELLKSFRLWTTRGNCPWSWNIYCSNFWPYTTEVS